MKGSGKAFSSIITSWPLACLCSSKLLNFLMYFIAIIVGGSTRCCRLNFLLLNIGNVDPFSTLTIHCGRDNVASYLLSAPFLIFV